MTDDYQPFAAHGETAFTYFSVPTGAPPLSQQIRVTRFDHGMIRIWAKHPYRTGYNYIDSAIVDVYSEHVSEFAARLYALAADLPTGELYDHILTEITDTDADSPEGAAVAAYRAVLPVLANLDIQVRQLTEDRDQARAELTDSDLRDQIASKILTATYPPEEWPDGPPGEGEMDTALEQADAVMAVIRPVIERITCERLSLTRRLNVRYGELSQARAEREEGLAKLAALERAHAEKCEAFTAYVEQHIATGGCQPVDGGGEVLC